MVNKEEDLKKTKRKINLMAFDGTRNTIRNEVLSYATPII